MSKPLIISSGQDDLERDLQESRGDAVSMEETWARERLKRDMMRRGQDTEPAMKGIAPREKIKRIPSCS